MVNKNVLAVIPARSGSKGLPDKNIRLLSGIPLLGHAGKVASACKLINKIIISTDSKKYQDIAQTYHIEAPFTRPKELSGDFISDIQVLTHALDSAESLYQIEFDIVLMLQPTSPFRSPALLSHVLTQLVEENVDAVWTISEVDMKFNPLKQLRINDGSLSLYLDEGAKIIARQQLTPTYIRNGQCYAFTRNAIRKEKTILPKNTAYHITPNYPNIDNLEDFELAEKLIGEFVI